MWANSVWGLLGLSVSSFYAMLGLPADSAFRPTLLIAGMAFFIGSLVVLCWPLKHRENRDKVRDLASHPLKAARLIEPVHIILLGLLIAVGGLIWQWRRAPPPDPRLAILESQVNDVKSQLAKSQKSVPALPPAASNATAPNSIAVVPLQPTAPRYTQNDIERLLEATFEISGLLQQAIPVRDNAQRLDQIWNEIATDPGADGARSKLKQVRLGVVALTEAGWAISNNTVTIIAK